MRRLVFSVIFAVTVSLFTESAYSGPNSGAVVSLDYIKDYDTPGLENAGNKINDGILYGVNTASGRREAVEVFVTGLVTPIRSARVAFSLSPHNRVLLGYVGNRDLFPETERGARLDTYVTVKTESPVSLSASGYLLLAELLVYVDKDADVEIGIETLIIEAESGERDTLRTNQKVVLLREGVQPPSAYSGPNSGAVVSLDYIKDYDTPGLENAGNKINDGILYGVNTASGRREAVEVFVTGLVTPIRSARVAFSLSPHNRVLLGYVGNRDLFPETERGARLDTYVTVKTESPVSLSASGYLLLAELLVYVDKDADVEIGIETLIIEAESGERDTLRTNQKVVLLREGVQPPSTPPGTTSGSSINTLSGSLKDNPWLKNDDISVWGNLGYYGNHKRLNERTKSIAMLSVENGDGNFSLAMRPPVIVYGFTIDIQHRDGKRDKVRMIPPQPAFNRSLHIVGGKIDGRAVELHGGFPIDYINGCADSDSSYDWNIYYIKYLCDRASDCTASIDYKVLDRDDYYTLEDLQGNTPVDDSLVNDLREELRAVRDKLAAAQKGDLDGNGEVNFTDFLLFAKHFGQPVGN